MQYPLRMGVDLSLDAEGYNVLYWSEDWEEIQDLRAESLSPVSAFHHIAHWLAERERMRRGEDALHPHLQAAVHLTIEMCNGEEGGDERSLNDPVPEGQASVPS